MLLILYIPGISGVLGVGQSCVSNMLVILYIPGISGVLGVGQSCVTPTCSRCYIYIPGIPGVLGEGQGCVSPTCSRCFGIPGVLGEGQGCVSPTCSRCYIYIYLVFLRWNLKNLSRGLIRQTRFKLSAGLNLETFHTILSGTNNI